MAHLSCPGQREEQKGHDNYVDQACQGQPRGHYDLQQLEHLGQHLKPRKEEGGMELSAWVGGWVGVYLL